MDYAENCSFCRKRQKQCEVFVKGPDGIYICETCVTQHQRMIQVPVWSRRLKTAVGIVLKPLFFLTRTRQATAE